MIPPSASFFSNSTNCILFCFERIDEILMSQGMNSLILSIYTAIQPLGAEILLETELIRS